MTDQTEVKEETQEPTTFKVVVTNTVNGVEGEVFSRECDWGKKDTLMKSVRQKIRDFDATIREANVTFNEDKSLQTIAFTDLVIKEKPTAKRTVSASTSARKNADATVATETDIEILSIARDDDVEKKERQDALSNYTRHQLIHAFNTHLSEEDQADRLSHYTTKAQAIAILLP